MKHIIKENEEYEILIYEPILSQVKQLDIEIPENYKIEFYDDKKDKTILIAGGNDSFGIGCTACGVMFPNILGRKLDYNIRNISFNENNYLKKTYENLKEYKHSKVDISILELDYIKQNDDIFDKYYKKVIKQLKNKSENLICWYAIPKTELNKHEKLEKIKDKFSNDKKIKILDLSFIYDEEYSEMCTHSKNFINDTGNIMIYKQLKQNIEEINSIKNNRRKRIWNI